MTLEEFAALRKPVMKQVEDALVHSVEYALRHWRQEGWYDSLVERALHELRRRYRIDSGNTSSANLRDAVESFARVLKDTLDKTTEPDPDRIETQARAIAASIASAVIAAGAEAAARDDGDAEHLVKVWISMEDNRVRPTHAAAHGQERALGEKFDVGGSEMSRPGDMTAPIDEWINCRCILAIQQGGAIPTAASAGVGQFFQKGDGMPEDLLLNEDTATDGMDPIGWHGVLAPEGVMSGDRRKFSPNALQWRDLPLPLSWQKVNAEGHDGSVIVGRIDAIWRDGNLVKAKGMMLDTPEADEVIGLMSEGGLRGVSIDGDSPVMQYELDDGRLISEMSDDEELAMDKVVQTFTSLRVSGATLCAIPAFQEAYIFLGSEDAMTAACEHEQAQEMAEEFEDDFRDVSTEERKRLAKKGAAMPDGSYPIANCQDLKNAIQAIGRAKNPDAVKRHIAKRKSALGCPDVELPWSVVDPDEQVDSEFEEFVKTEDGPGWLTHPVDTERLRRYWTKGPGAAKIRWGIPGDFNRCRRQLAKYVKPQYLSGYCANRHYDALGFWPGRPVAADTEVFDGEPVHLTAAAEPDFKPPKEWFSDPQLTGPSPLTITDEGRVFGHLATWGTCHIGLPGSCTTAPRSNVDYAYFRVGYVVTDDGDVPVGHITMGTGHAAGGLSARRAIEHYDNTGWVAADIAAGEDEYGIWVAGMTRRTLSADDLHTLRAAALSGDWRDIGGRLELVAALAVNVPGFPIPRLEIAASGGHQTSLVAAGLVIPPKPVTVLDEEALAKIVGKAIEHHFNVQKFNAMKVKANQRKAEANKARMAELAAERSK